MAMKEEYLRRDKWRDFDWKKKKKKIHWEREREIRINSAVSLSNHELFYFHLISSIEEKELISEHLLDQLKKKRKKNTHLARRDEQEEKEMSNNKADSCFFFLSFFLSFDPIWSNSFLLPFQDIPDTIIQLKQIELVIYVRLLHQSISNTDELMTMTNKKKFFSSTFHAEMILNNFNSTSMNFWQIGNENNKFNNERENVNQ